MERQGRLYPIGIQTFEKIRVGNYMYIDRVFSLMFRKTSFKTPKILIKTRA